MSETPMDDQAGAGAEAPGGGSGRGLMWAVIGAMWTDFGCLIGALAFVILILGSWAFAAQLTPCTSAGGIPCNP